MPLEGDFSLPPGCVGPQLLPVGQTLQPELHEEEAVSRTGELSLTLPASSPNIGTFWRTFQRDATSRGMTAFLMFLAGSAGVWQPRLRGSGTVEGHNGSPGESGGRVAQVEPCLKLSAQLPYYCCAARPAVRSCVNSRPSLRTSLDSDGPPSGLLNAVGPGRHFRLSVVNKGLEQNVGAGKRFCLFFM